MTVSQPLETRRDLEGEAWETLGSLWITQRPVLMELARKLDLFPPQIMVIQSLDQPRPMSQVADFLSCNSSNLTGIADRLESRGLVQRTPDPDDRRVRLLVLTDEGRKVQRKVNKVLRKPPAAMKSLSEDELITLAELLGKLEARIPEG
ncbi:MAG: hypothetical protein QG596_685 [Actinomycetota bacterium]|jgi:DNA-binding MarR family transcriptional regulator|nr:hypothetical protein [Actinomycetota bacterium]